MTADPYAFWQAQLAGKPIDLDDKLPRVGFYRKSDQPIAIWMAGDEMVAKVGKGRVQPADAGFAEQTFAWCCRSAISHPTYTAVMEGAPWPDAAPDVKAEMGHNLPDDPFERAVIELEAHAERVAEFLKSPIQDEESATKAGLWSGKLAGLSKEFDGLFRTAKRPHDDALKEVRSTFAPKIDFADALSKRLKQHMVPWLEAKKARAKAEEDAKREAEAKAAESLEMAPPPAREIARQPSKVVTGGVKLVTRKVAFITDLKAAALFYASFDNPPEPFVAMVRSMADKNLKAGTDVPGAELRETQGVA